MGLGIQGSWVKHSAYYGKHTALLFSFSTLQRALRTATKQHSRPSTQTIHELRRRYRDLLQSDIRNAEEGFYPQKLLSAPSLAQVLIYLPNLLLELPRMHRRRQRNGHRELPSGIHEENYPSYYQQNFHWQSDGYLSQRSANIYDAQVEFLFLGVADVMRRQVIPPIKRFLQQCGPQGEPAKLLDVGCGTGRSLAQLRASLPYLRCTGLDLSPYYLLHARRALRGNDVRWVEGHAEKLPFHSEYFDIVTSTYLFHELPKYARRAALKEMMRVLKPGGLLVIEDSVQCRDSAVLMPVLKRFYEDFHEPYYRHYLDDTLEDILHEVGFGAVVAKTHFVSKVVVAERI